MEVIEINEATKVMTEIMDYILMMAITAGLSVIAAFSLYFAIVLLTNITVSNPFGCVVSIAGFIWSATGIVVVVRSN